MKIRGNQRSFQKGSRLYIAVVARAGRRSGVMIRKK
jgi:hypothetical protein